MSNQGSEAGRFSDLPRVAKIAGALAAIGLVYGIATHLPFASIGENEIGLRLNQLTGRTTELHEGAALVLPGLHRLRVYSMKDHLYKPDRSAKATAAAPFQSSEGLSLGVELTIRYALDPSKLLATASQLPPDIDKEIVDPLVQGVIYKVFTRYTVREIFSTRRQELQEVLEGELKPLLAADGLVLRAVMIGNVDLPADYRAGMDKLLATELQTEQMQYTLQLKEKQVRESELVAEADKVRREKAAEAAANEQIIAAKAQEEAMKHVLPFKQRQIEQRQLEAEAERVARVKAAEGNAQARRIEANGEADARQKLAEAEAYRMDRIGKVNAEQMAREGALVTRHPLLIQRTLADKLSDKVQVIIASPGAPGGFIGANLLGGPGATGARQTAAAQE